MANLSAADDKLGRYRSEFEDFKVTLDVEHRCQVPKMPNRRRCLKRTREWWDAVVSLPQAELFTEADWQRLCDLAALKDAYNRLAWSDPESAGYGRNVAASVRLMAEIRQNETLLGLTLLDRMRARIRVERKDANPEPAEVPESVAVLADYRRLLGA